MFAADEASIWIMCNLASCSAGRPSNVWTGSQRYPVEATNDCRKVDDNLLGVVVKRSVLLGGIDLNNRVSHKSLRFCKIFCLLGFCRSLGFVVHLLSYRDLDRRGRVFKFSQNRGSTLK